MTGPSSLPMQSSQNGPSTPSRNAGDGRQNRLQLYVETGEGQPDSPVRAEIFQGNQAPPERPNSDCTARAITNSSSVRITRTQVEDPSAEMTSALRSFRAGSSRTPKNSSPSEMRA